MASQYNPASISPDQLAEVQKLEQSIGKVVVAMAPEEQEEQTVAKLKPEQIAQIKLAEEKLGVVIVAYE